ncbi:squalene synthase HpnC, partial [bacterium]|nr:squalene synthase HpnC [bacterium]
PTGAKWTVEEAYAFCRQLTVSHYENFPVGSMLLPKKVRPHVYAIYAFARVSDDFADEAVYQTKEQRLHLLADWQNKLEECYRGRADHPVFIALADTVKKIDLPIELFSDLLTAFKRDVTVNRYQTFDEVINAYCRYSANPVGRLILYLFDYRDEERHRLSDHICTALQLTNFWQDVAIDLQKNRVYIPLEDMQQAGYTVEELFQHVYDERYCGIMQNLVKKTWDLFEQGYPLLESVRFPLNAELRFTWLGGVAILSRTLEYKYNVFANRPKLSKWDFLKLGSTSFLPIRRLKRKKKRQFEPLAR